MKLKKVWEQYTEEQIVSFYNQAENYSQLCRLFNLSKRYGSAYFKEMLEKYHLDPDKLDRYKQARIKLKGKIFNYLEAIEVDEERTNETGHIYWKCKCLLCNNITSVRATNLKSGAIKSCGCLQGKGNREDLTNQQFGWLKAIEFDEEKTKYSRKNGSGKTYWKCQCLRCGRPDLVSVHTYHLKTGHTTTCGCLTSVAEQEIKKILNKYCINYQQQYSFDDLIGENRKLRFDFAIFKNNKLFCLIEYNGLQHYEPRSGFGGEEAFKKQQLFDQKKKNIVKNIIFL